MTGALAHYLEEALGRSEAPIEDGDGAAVATQHLLAQARAIALDLSAIAPGEPVLATIANAPADLAAMLGVWLAGGVVVPVPANAPARAAEAVQQATGARFRVDGNRVASVAQIRPPARQHLREAALVIFTSGSTGKPKGVVIGHDRMAGKLAVLGRLLGLSAAGQRRRPAAPDLHLRHLGEPAGGAQRRPPGAGAQVHAGRHGQDPRRRRHRAGGRADHAAEHAGQRRYCRARRCARSSPAARRWARRSAAACGRRCRRRASTTSTA